MNVGIAGLVVALPEECRSLTTRRVGRGDCFALDETRLVCVSGVGADNAARAARRLVEAGARGLVSWGCAAALARNMKSGDLCLPAQIVDTHARRWTAAEPWHLRARQALHDVSNVCTGTLLTADQVVATAADKASLAAQCGGAVAVDMESAAAATVANEHALPFLAVRAIADPSDMTLPRAALRALDAAGTLRRAALLAELLRHPGELTALLRVGSQFRAALRTLARAADRMGAGLLLDEGSA